jgi:hypothetical protein
VAVRSQNPGSRIYTSNKSKHICLLSTCLPTYLVRCAYTPTQPHPATSSFWGAWGALGCAAAQGAPRFRFQPPLNASRPPLHLSTQLTTALLSSAIRPVPCLLRARYTGHQSVVAPSVRESPARGTARTCNAQGRSLVIVSRRAERGLRCCRALTPSETYGTFQPRVTTPPSWQTQAVPTRCVTCQ